MNQDNKTNQPFENAMTAAMRKAGLAKPLNTDKPQEQKQSKPQA